MNVPPIIASFECSHCGARSQSREGKCWLCYEEKSNTNPYSVSQSQIAQSATQKQMSSWDVVFGALLVACVVLTVLIAIGIAVQDRGMLIPFAILVGPAYLVTIIRGVAQSNSTPRPTNLFLTFIVSLLATVGVMVVLAIASVVLLMIVCLQSM
jgi:hypothetical protein